MPLKGASSMNRQVSRHGVPLILLLLFLVGCGSSQQYTAMPPDINRDQVPHQTIEMTAQRYQFTPDEIHVKAGTLVTLKITALDGTHGFKLGAFGIDERLEQKQEKIIEFYAGAKGEYGFKCSHLCGIGHFSMNGKIVVE